MDGLAGAQTWFVAPRSAQLGVVTEPFVDREGPLHAEGRASFGARREQGAVGVEPGGGTVMAAATVVLVSGHSVDGLSWTPHRRTTPMRRWSLAKLLT